MNPASGLHRMAPWLIAASFLTLFGLKIYLYYTLHYISDIFSFMEAATSWMRGMPILSDTIWGPTTTQHNYYIMLAIGPLVHWLGGSGLFVASALVFTVAGVWVVNHFRSQWSVEELVLFLSLYLGPVTLWLWDEPVVGWHADVLFFPFSLLYLISLRHGSPRFVIPAFLILFFTREEGAVVAFSVHLLHSASGVLSGPFPFRRLLKSVVRLALFYLPLFLLGLLIIKFHVGWNSPGKVTQAFGHLALLSSNEAAKNGLIQSLRVWGLILGPLLLLFCIQRAGAFRAFSVLLAILPLLLVAVVGGISYSNQYTYGVLFPPRFAISYGMAMVAFVAFSGGLLDRRPIFRRLLRGCGVALFSYHLVLMSQLGFLNNYREFFGPDRPKSLLSANESRGLRCIASGVSRRDTVVSTPNFYVFFERHSRAYADSLHTAFGPYSLVVCDRANRFRDYDCTKLQDRLAASGWPTVRLENISISYESRHGETLSRCGAA